MGQIQWEYRYETRCKNVDLIRNELENLLNFDENRRRKELGLVNLKWRETTIFSLRYGFHNDSTRHKYTLSEIGKKLMISPERVRQLEYNTIRKIEKMLISRLATKE